MGYEGRMALVDQSIILELGLGLGLIMDHKELFKVI
jgi:hypothetical protein